MRSKRFALYLAPVLTIVIGLILMINSVGTTVFICRAIGIVLIVSGVIFTGSALLNINSVTHRYSAIPGIIQLLIGIFIAACPEKLVGILTIIIGIIILVQSFSILDHAFETKFVGYRLWWITAVIALIMAVLGIVVIVNPFGAVSAALKFTGIVLIVQGISDIITRYRTNKIIDSIKKQNGTDYIDAEYTIKK